MGARRLTMSERFRQAASRSSCSLTNRTPHESAGAEPEGALDDQRLAGDVACDVEGSRT
jgi:hypothetical protein